MESSSGNQNAWMGDTYAAWVKRYGTPEQVVGRLRKNPTTVLEPIRRHFGRVAGKHIVNIMGSNGVKALALSMLGGDVTVIDFSPGNARYAEELATVAGLDLNYIVSDVLSPDLDSLKGTFDVAFAEMGIIHYFEDLNPFMGVAAKLLASGGRLVLRDFHPISTKLITSRGTTAKIRKHKVTGDYFDTSLEERPASFWKHLECQDDSDSPTVQWRRWTLGEIVTAVAKSGLVIQSLDEEANPSGFDRGIPKTFVLVADRAQGTDVGRGAE
jgi:2-polyprenyl-3-methyl-5-hydroxy-6-metoxy-1,4-benzoquinol methylase